MKVLITGAGGNLGRILAPALAERGHEPILMDNRTIETSYPIIHGDVTNKQDVDEAVSGVDAIVHAAALHGIHLTKYTAADFWNLNVTGTHNIYQAAVESGVQKILLCSTMGVYGDSIKPLDDTFAIVKEELPSLPRDIYGLSKKLCEEMAEFYSRRHGIQTIAYRLGMFVPEDFVRYGFRLLKGGVDDRDVARAFILGLENNTISFDTFNIMAEVPFSINEFPAWRDKPLELLETYYPDITELVRERDIHIEDLLNMWGHTYWSIDKAKELLGYRPDYNFSEFYSALKENKESHYPFANLQWWGIER